MLSVYSYFIRKTVLGYLIKYLLHNTQKKYFSDKNIDRLKKRKQIFFKYCDWNASQLCYRSETSDRDVQGIFDKTNPSNRFIQVFLVVSI